MNDPGETIPQLVQAGWHSRPPSRAGPGVQPTKRMQARAKRPEQEPAGESFDQPFQRD